MRAAWLIPILACSTSTPALRAPVAAPAPAAAPAAAPAPAATTPSPVVVPLDTSVATVWGYDPNRASTEPPPAPSPPLPREEQEHVAITAPRARVAGRRAPCFPQRDVLVASEIYRDLQDYALYMGQEEDAPPRGRYGTCTVENSELRDARGTLIAELHCGITVHVRGIIDQFGFEIGAHGKDVAAEHHAGEILCWADGEKHARCWFQPADGDEARAHYSFPVSIDTRAGENGPLRGAAARAVFEQHDVTSFTQRMWCH